MLTAAINKLQLYTGLKPKQTFFNTLFIDFNNDKVSYFKITCNLFFKTCNWNTGKLGIHDVTTKGSARTFRVIQLLLSAGDQGIYIQGVPSKHAEAYSLEVDTEREIITIRGNEPVGVFYGVQSLMSVTENGWVPHITIQDAPR